MKNCFKYDYYQYRFEYGQKIQKSKWGGVKAFVKEPSLRYLFFQRKSDSSKGIASKIYWIASRLIGKKYGFDLFTANIGKYLYLGHAFGITVNPRAILGNCVSLHKGCTIGQENRGQRKGYPTVGNCVWIGMNAIVVGKINIGNDVLIAPNAYVNFDVPSHSIVIGNPGVIIHKDHATRYYLRYANEDNYENLFSESLCDV